MNLFRKIVNIVLFLLYYGCMIGIAQDRDFSNFDDFTEGSWEGHYQNSEDSALNHIISWSYNLDRNMVKMEKKVPELNFISETFFFIDFENELLSFITFYNKGIISKGEVKLFEKKIHLIGKTFYGEGASDFEQIFEKEGPNCITDKFYRIMNNKKKQGHYIRYKIKQND